MAYEECKKQVILTITKPIEELFKVQSGLDVENEVEMENIRQVYGLLLELCASKTHLASARAMETICGKVCLAAINNNKNTKYLNIMRFSYNSLVIVVNRSDSSKNLLFTVILNIIHYIAYMKL